MDLFIQINNASDLEAVVNSILRSELHKDLNQLDEYMSNASYSVLDKALVYAELDIVDRAEAGFLAAKQAGDVFFEKLIPFLNNKIIPSAISVDVFEYISLRTSKTEIYRDIAAAYIAPKLILNSEDKLTLIKTILKLSKIEGSVLNGKISFTNLNVESLWSELNIPQALVEDVRIQAAIEYSQDVEIELSIKNNEPTWIIKPALSSAWDKIKSHIQDNLEVLAANTVYNPTFRKVATVCVVIGVAVYAQDSMAGDTLDSLDKFADKVDSTLKAAVDAKDSACDASNFSAKFIKEGKANYEFIARIGDYQVSYDVTGFDTGRQGLMNVAKPVVTKIGNSCAGYSEDEIVNMIKPISQGLIKRVF